MSLGASYAGFERLVLGCDVRYFDYGNTDGFKKTGFGPMGAIQGLGLRSILAVSTGVQYQATDFFYLRCGYSFNENPIDAANTAFNVGSPLITQHFVYAGASYGLTSSTSVDIAYLHGFRNSLHGPLLTPVGVIPGSFVRSEASLDVLTVGLTVRF
ncbi:MAG: outer membrane protein transport protein [Planctomycetes bacterium]|nr:outer membrane protein transport protein [Planctomycetota bacterium]